MKFLKKKAIYLLMAVIAISTAVSIGVSIKISITMIEKKSQLVEARAAADKSLPVAGKALQNENIYKAERYPVYFNGSTEKAFEYYYCESKKGLIPFDDFLKQLDLPFNLYNSDDVLQTKLENQPLEIFLNSKRAVYGKDEKKLDIPSFSADDHIFVSSDVLKLTDGFSINDSNGADGVFLNYWLPTRTKDYRNNYLLVLSSGVPELAGLLDGSRLTFTEEGLGKLDVVIYCQDLSAYLLKAGQRTWYLDEDNFKKPRLLDVPAQYEVSSGGRYIYWMEDSGEFIYVYDIDKGSIKKLRNILADIKSGNGDIYKEMNLKDYMVGRYYERLDFKEKSGTVTYTIIVRRGKVVAEGESAYSPDGKKLLFYDSLKGYYVIDGDGTDSISLGNAESTSWIDNDRIELKSDNETRIFSRSKRNYTTTAQDERYIGMTSSGLVFFQKGNIIYGSSGPIHKELFNMPWQMDYISAYSAKGPFHVVSLNSNSILGIWGDKRLFLGSPDRFVNKPVIYTAEAAFNMNTAVSSDGKKIAILQKSDRFLELNIASYTGMKLDKVMLDYRVDNADDTSYLWVKWLNGNGVLVYNDLQGWIVDIKSGIHIFKWINNESESTIAAFLSKSKLK